jgi:hypothetical protein
VGLANTICPIFDGAIAGRFPGIRCTVVPAMVAPRHALAWQGLMHPGM